MSIRPMGLSPAQAVAAAAGTYALKKFDPVVKLIPLPGLLQSDWQWNAAPWIQDNVTTVGTTQYAVWANDSANPVIGKRTLPDGAWSTFDLSTVASNPLVAPTAEDGHNTYAVARDSAGYLWVIGNLHTDALRMVRSTNPDDISAWVAVTSLVGTQESSMTYPQFINHPDGTLLLLYRDGGSGNGNTYLNRLSNAATHTWARVGAVLVEAGIDENAYVQHVDCDVSGVIHLAYCWRSSYASVDTNSDMCYIKSADKGVTWTDVSGAAVSAPVSHMTSPKALDTADTGSGLVNNGGLMVDANGYPHIAYLLSDGTNRQIYHLWWNGSAWINDKITSFTVSGTGGTWPPRPSIFCYGGRTYILHVYFYEGTRGSLRCIDVTPGRSGYDVFPLCDIDLQYFEPTFDSRALRDRGELIMLVSSVVRTRGEANPEYWHDDNWLKQWGGILKVDLSRFEQVQHRVARLPRIRSIAVHSLQWNQSIANTGALAAIGGTSGGVLIPPAETHGKLVFVRLSIRGNVSANGTVVSVGVRELQNGGAGSSRTWNGVSFSSTSSTIKKTPWMPLVYGPRNLFDCFVDVQAAITTGAGTGTINGTLEVGVLDAP